MKKIADTKFLACPASTVTPRSWQIIRLVNECTGGESCDLLHLPFAGTLLDQPPWFREAVQMMRQERARHRREQMNTTR